MDSTAFHVYMIQNEKNMKNTGHKQNVGFHIISHDAYNNRICKHQQAILQTDVTF